MAKTIQEKIALAVAASLPSDTLREVQSLMQEAAERATAVADKAGIPVYIQATAGLDDGSLLWPTTLAGTLCEAPELAKGTRDDMAHLLTSVMSLSTPFRSNRLSRSLSRASKQHVTGLLSEYGYSGNTLTNGLSIRDIVKRGKAVTDLPETEQTITTRFYADRVVMDGLTFRYKRRDRVPTGNAWNDLALRVSIGVAGVDTPLLTLLKFRGIGIGQFISLDEHARSIASADELAARAELDRDYAVNVRATARLADLAVSAATTSNVIPEHAG